MGQGDEGPQNNPHPRQTPLPSSRPAQGLKLVSGGRSDRPDHVYPAGAKAHLCEQNRSPRRRILYGIGQQTQIICADSLESITQVIRMVAFKPFSEGGLYEIRNFQPELLFDCDGVEPDIAASSNRKRTAEGR